MSCVSASAPHHWYRIKSGKSVGPGRANFIAIVFPSEAEGPEAVFHVRGVFKGNGD